MYFLEDLEVGFRRELGSFTFTTENIKVFAREFDPQPFHLDEEAGRASLFGGLAASGWHICSVAMKLLVNDGKRISRELRERGETPAVWGPSPGFVDLKWPNPVLAGDVVSYATVIMKIRVSNSKPGWGLVQSNNIATNQRGETVMSFHATAFAPMRDAKSDSTKT